MASTTMYMETAENVENDLSQSAMLSKWDEVVSIYGKYPRACELKITKSGDTALHIAVSDGQERHVEELVQLVSKWELEIRNERGNTPLHIAASVGSVRMCDCIAKKNSSLVGAPNEEKETPLFTAALHGNKDAFLCLHYICTPDGHPKHYDYCRRADGMTILHCAIAGEYFDLAFQIIHLYGDLVNSVNAEGFSPLHLLASKPEAFASGNLLGPFDKFISHCIYVDELKVEGPDHFHRRWQAIIERIQDENHEKHSKYPQQYQTCINFLWFFWNIVRVVGNKKEDEENPRPVGPVQLNHALARDGRDPGSFRTPRLHQSHYITCFEFVKCLSKAMVNVLVLGYSSDQIRMIRQRQKWSNQIMNELIKHVYMYDYGGSGMNPLRSKYYSDETRPYAIVGRGPGGDIVPLGRIDSIEYMTPPGTADADSSEHFLGKTTLGSGSIEQYTGKYANKKRAAEGLVSKVETAFLVAAKYGTTEVVEKILELFPVAVYDTNAEQKNVVHLAVENRQSHVYKLLLKRNILKESVFSAVDEKGNSALHLAARLEAYKPWQILGPALQMQWEIKWYEFVKDSMPADFFSRYNNEGETPEEIFTETHKVMVKAAGECLSKTSESCSVVGALIATVAFATATTVPGGVNEDTGRPTLENQPAFVVFAISSLVALCLSITSMVIFLSILMSRNQERDFRKDLPRKLLLGLTSLFMSMVSMLISFCAGHLLLLKNKLKHSTLPVYAITFLPLALFILGHLPVYCNMIWAVLKKVPLHRPGEV